MSDSVPLHQCATQEAKRGAENDEQVKQMVLEGIGHFFEHLIARNADASAAHSCFHSRVAPSMSASEYVARVARYARCSWEALVAAVLYLHDYLTRSQHPLSVLNFHRLFITAVVLGAKYRDDHFYSNTYYAKVGGVSPGELFVLEVAFAEQLQWDLWLCEDLFTDATQLLLHFAGTNPLDELAAGKADAWMIRQRFSSQQRRQAVEEKTERDRHWVRNRCNAENAAKTLLKAGEAADGGVVPEESVSGLSFYMSSESGELRNG